VLSSSADLQAAGQVRFGNINTDATLAGVLRFGTLNALPQKNANFGYLQAQARAVGYDATMQGGYFSKNNPHTVAPKRVYPQIELGWEWISPEYAAKVAVVRRGNTIRDLPNNLGAQNYAVLQFSYTPSR
jgi:lipid A 3-O-deacylase